MTSKPLINRYCRGSEEMAQLMALRDGQLLHHTAYCYGCRMSTRFSAQTGNSIMLVINGDAEAGVTIMEMVKEMDAGNEAAHENESRPSCKRCR